MDSILKRALGGAAILILVPAAALADSGPYIGVGAGGATLEADFGSGTPPVPGIPDSLDEDDTALKVFGGYTFDLPLIDIGIEGAYVDFGEPEIDILGNQLSINTTGFSLWGIASLNAGLIDLYAKAGYLAWDVEAEILGVSDSTDGSDLGYGIGAAFGLGPVEIRGEYEVYDLDEFDVAMLSLGVLFRF
jgi:hypothetical protein